MDVAAMRRQRRSLVHGREGSLGAAIDDGHKAIRGDARAMRPTHLSAQKICSYHRARITISISNGEKEGRRII
jgi:hypothetical protein